MSLLTVTPIQTGLNFSVWALVCFIFNYLIRRRASAWWGKYTMTMSAALDSGLAFALVVVFFGFIYPGWMDGFRWWGTEVYKQVRLINYSFYSRSIVDAWRVGLRLASMSLQTLGAWGAFWTTIITDSYMNHTQINILNSFVVHSVVLWILQTSLSRLLFSHAVATLPPPKECCR